MTLERVSIIWARIALVPLSRGVTALALVCAGAFALGLAVGLPAATQVPSGGLAAGGLGNKPVTVSDHTRLAPKPATHIPTTPAPRPGGAGNAPAFTAPPLPPAEGDQPGYYTIPPWSGNDGEGNGPGQNPGWQPQPQYPGGDQGYYPWAGPQGDNGGGPGGPGWHPGHHGHHHGGD